MAYTTNHFCWHGIHSTDVEAAVGFYGSALPFTIQTADMGGEDVPMVAAGSIPRAHIAPPAAEGVPSHWSSYLRVDDVDASASAAVANGGKLLVPGTDIVPGRFAVVASPSGATFNLFHEADEATSQNPPSAGPGAIHWTELHSHDVDADLAWLESTFGFTVSEMAMPDGPYYLLMVGDEAAGGVMKAQEAKAPSMWLNWVAVDDADEAVAAIGAAGGNVVAPTWDVPGVGRMAIVADPTGGVFGVIKPSPRQG